jgi:hypothetical protein
MPFRVKLNEDVAPGAPFGAEKGDLYKGEGDYYSFLDGGVLQVHVESKNWTVHYAPGHWLYVETLDGQLPGPV